MRALFLTVCLLALAALAVPSQAAEVPPPVGGCDSDATVEYCQPVCVTTPCNPYVCVNHRLVEQCWYP